MLSAADLSVESRAKVHLTDVSKEKTAVVIEYGNKHEFQRHAAECVLLEIYA